MLTRIGVFLAFIALFAAGGANAESPSALAAKLTQDDGVVRVELGLSERVAFKISSHDGPPRIFVDFPALEWRLIAPRAGEELRLVKGLRFGMIQRGAARMVIDLKETARVSSAFTEEAVGAAPSRFVVELVEADEEAFAEDVGRAARAAEDAASLAPPTPTPRPERGVVVVLDPGHGGVDPGARVGGVVEKALVYDYAVALAARIEARPGFRARITRGPDEFVSLRERVERAARLGADLFVSLHADALASGIATGASVYTLSEDASDEEAAALVGSLNRALEVEGVNMSEQADDVASILIVMAQRDTNKRSEALASLVVEKLSKASPVLEGRAQQSAGFRVLKSPDAPSILIELGFLSSAADIRRLTSPEGREKIIIAIDRAIAEFAANDERLREKIVAR